MRYLKEIDIAYSTHEATYWQTNAPLQKTDLRRLEPVGDEYPSARQFAAAKEITINGITYYAEADDTEVGIPASDLVESVKFEAIQPTTMKLSQQTAKYNVGTKQFTGASFSTNLTRLFTSRVMLDGQWFYRSESDTDGSLALAFPASKLQSATFETFVTPRYLTTKQDTNYRLAGSEKPIGGTIKSGTTIYFNSKIITDGVWLYRSKTDTEAGNNLVIPADQLANGCFEPFVSPRTMVLVRSAHKYNLTTGQALPELFPLGLTRKFVTKTLVNGHWYYRTESDTNSGTCVAFRAEDLL
jgi:hypothetical protein